MLFPTLTFALFFAVVLPLSWALRDRTEVWKVMILIASYIFYGWWDWRFLGLIIAVTVVNEVAAVGIFRSENDTTRKQMTALAIAANLGLLGSVSYTHLTLPTICRV